MKKQPKPMTIRQFFVIYPDDDACLEQVMRARYGDRHQCAKCGKSAHYYRLRQRQSYECEYCAHHLYPCVGTPFEKSRTPLQYWFFAMYLFCASRNGVAAKELQRQLGVTYKCAFRMGHKIREFMGEADGNTPLGGFGRMVEIDETFIGGRDPKGKATSISCWARSSVAAKCRPRSLIAATARTLLAVRSGMLARGAHVVTDDYVAYTALPALGHPHSAVNHSSEEWARGPYHTNTIENFWAQLKRSIDGTYIHVSKKHLPKYLSEFEYRFNLRKTPYAMFQILTYAFARPRLAPSLA